MTGRSWLAGGLVLLALGLAVNSLLGPFLLDVIEYPLSETLLNQGIGLDAASLIVVAPLALLAAWLHADARPAGALLGIALGAYTAYMAVQYLAGPEYLVYAHVFPFHLALFIAGVTVGLASWNAASQAGSADGSVAHRRVLLALIIAAGAFVVLRYLPALGGAFTEEPLTDEYAEQPTMYWTIVLMDLGLFVPSAIAAAVGLLRRAPWAAVAGYAVVVWFALVTVAVSGMSIAMYANDDPYASGTGMVMFIAMGIVVCGLVAWLLRPLVHEGPAQSGRTPPMTGTQVTGRARG